MIDAGLAREPAAATVSTSPSALSLLASLTLHGLLLATAFGLLFTTQPAEPLTVLAVTIVDGTEQDAAPEQAATADQPASPPVAEPDREPSRAAPAPAAALPEPTLEPAEEPPSPAAREFAAPAIDRMPQPEEVEREAARPPESLPPAPVDLAPKAAPPRAAAPASPAKPAGTTPPKVTAPAAPERPAATEAVSPPTQTPGAGSAPGNVSAQPLARAPPIYPVSARERGAQGRVVLSVLVGPDGRPGQVDVQQSSGHADLDRAARDAVKQWPFQPARRAGVAVPETILVPVIFNLR